MKWKYHVLAAFVCGAVLCRSAITALAQAEPDEAARKRAEAVREWNNAAHGRSPYLDRAMVFPKMQAYLQGAMSTGAVVALLGVPDGIVQDAQGVIHTYLLSWTEAVQFFYDSAGELGTQSRIEFYSYPKYLGKESGRPRWAVTPGFPAQREKTALAQLWRVLSAFPWDTDRAEVAERLVKHVPVGMERRDVETMLGKAKGYCAGGGGQIATYSLTLLNGFLQVWYDGDGKVTTCYTRQYDRRTGAGSPGRAELGLSVEQDGLADKAAWLATTKEYDMTADRRGIGKRMVTYLKPGMTREEVLELLGDPCEVGRVVDGIKRYYRRGREDIHSDPRILREAKTYSYELYSTSAFNVDFDAEGKLLRVRHVGT